MRGAVLYGPRDIRFEDRETPKIVEPTDAVIRIAVTCVCGSWIWSVAVDGVLYVRAYYGQDARWYRVAMRQKAGRIISAGMTKEVVLEPVDGPINDLIDDAYRAKYHDSPYLSPMISTRARSATVKVMPRDGDG